MREPDRDGAAVRFPPPLMFALVVAAGIGLERWVTPLSLEGLPLRRPLALLLALAGIGLVVAAIVPFIRTGQNPEPWKPTPSIVAGGIYRLTRNPMYLSMAAFQAAVALAYAKGWLLALVPLSLAIVYRFAIRAEEVYLERKFGEEYLAYKRAVRRWF